MSIGSKIISHGLGVVPHSLERSVRLLDRGPIGSLNGPRMEVPCASGCHRHPNQAISFLALGRAVARGGQIRGKARTRLAAPQEPRLAQSRYRSGPRPAGPDIKDEPGQIVQNENEQKYTSIRPCSGKKATQATCPTGPGPGRPRPRQGSPVAAPAAPPRRVRSPCVASDHDHHHNQSRF